MHRSKDNRLSSTSDSGSPSCPLRKCASDELILRQRVEKRIISGFSREVSRSLKIRTEVASSIPLEFPEGILPSRFSETALPDVSATHSDVDVRGLYEKFKELELEIQILNHKISYYFMGLQKRLRNARRKLKQVMRDAKNQGVYYEYNANLKQNDTSSGDGTASRQPSISFGPTNIRRIPSRKELKQIINAKSRFSKSKSPSKDIKKNTAGGHGRRKRRREQTEADAEHSLSPCRKRRRKDSSDAGNRTEEAETGTNVSCFHKVTPPRASVRQYRKRGRHGGHKR